MTYLCEWCLHAFHGTQETRECPHCKAGKDYLMEWARYREVMRELHDMCISLAPIASPRVRYPSPAMAGG